MSYRDFPGNSRYNDGTTWFRADHADYLALRRALLRTQGLGVLFKHALVQDAAYGTLLRRPRSALHARIAETLESQFPDIAERQPELLARHCTEAGLVEKAAGLWGKAGQRSLERSARRILLLRPRSEASAAAN